MNAVMTDEITLSAEQQALFNVMEKTHDNLFITGYAGTGKSVLLNYFRNNTTKKVAVCAPTGIAALNVRGSTIHSLFKLKTELFQGQLSLNPRACSLLKRFDAIVIDEVSMVRADVMEAIDKRLREALDFRLPFGGMQIIMFGDVYQLPPVVEKSLANTSYFQKNNGGPFFFNAKVWQQTDFQIYELTQVFRQKDPVFKDILNSVRNGTFTDEHITQLNARYGVPIPEEGTITLVSTNAMVTRINDARLDQLDSELHEYEAVITSEKEEGATFSGFPTEEKLKLKAGSPVVLLNNDKDGRWVNGTIGKVVGFEDDEINVSVGGVVYPLEQVTWEEIQYVYEDGEIKAKVVATFTQYPVRLAWALTGHKSQGQTYDSVVVDLTSPTFAAGQLYVMLSRCTSMEGLFLKIPVHRKHVLVDSTVAAFMAKKAAIIVEAEEIVQAVLEQAPIEVPPPVEEVPAINQQNPEELPQAVEVVQADPPQETKPVKKTRQGHGTKKAVISVSIDLDMQAFLDSMPDINVSKFINRLLREQAERQQWENE